MAWNEPGSGQKDPWGKNRSSDGNKPRMDDLLKKLQARLRQLGGGGGLLTGVLVILVVLLLFSSYTIINTNQTGVVLRFGQYSRSLDPGFHLKLPQPIESVRKVETTVVRSMSDQARMLTSDENIISVDFNVQYQVSDARRYLFSTSDPEDTLNQAAEAAVRTIVGAHTMDDILTSPSDSDALAAVTPAGAATAVAPAKAASVPGVPSKVAGVSSAAAKPKPTADKVTLQQEARDALQRTLNSYKTGVVVNDVSFQNVAPPQEVKAAFDDVNSAREDKQSSVNEAYAYANKVVPQATGDAARITARAEGDKAERIARAEGDTDRFNLLLAQYKQAPAVTERRLYLETMEKVLADNPKVIDGSGGRNIINLPIDKLQTVKDGISGVSAGVTVTADSDSDSDADGQGSQP